LPLIDRSKGVSTGSEPGSEPASASSGPSLGLFKFKSNSYTGGSSLPLLKSWISVVTSGSVLKNWAAKSSREPLGSNENPTLCDGASDPNGKGLGPGPILLAFMNGADMMNEPRE